MTGVTVCISEQPNKSFHRDLLAVDITEFNKSAEYKVGHYNITVNAQLIINTNFMK